MEERVRDLIRAGIAVELLVPARADEGGLVGIRLRTFGKDLPKNKMVLGHAATFESALEDACGKAADGRWERLDWATRPWSVKTRGDLNVIATWGLT